MVFILKDSADPTSPSPTWSDVNRDTTTTIVYKLYIIRMFQEHYKYIFNMMELMCVTDIYSSCP